MVTHTGRGSGVLGPHTETSGGSDPQESDLDEFIDVVRSFASDCRHALFSGRNGVDPGPDGDLSAVPQLLDRARSIGLMADPSAGVEDGDFGVWGASSLELGPGPSLRALSVLAETCAGFAASIHAQGMGRLSLNDRRVSVDGVNGVNGTTIAAAFVPEAGIVIDDRAQHGAVMAISGPRAEPGVLRGRSRFVWASARPDHLTVFCRDGSEPFIVTVPGDSKGLSMVPVTGVVGLRAVGRFEVDLVDVPFDAASVVASGGDAVSSVCRMSALDWLGLAAIGLGAARGALNKAASYASTRIQGGVAIVEHASVRLLLAQASHDVTTLTAVLAAVPDKPIGSISDDDLLSYAISARLAMADHAFRAVSNCIQVLGGYGYMDDYGISKRLRDVSALRSRHGNREQLMLALASLNGHVPDPPSSGDARSGVG